MKSINDIKSEITEILATKWNTRVGQKVPEPSDVELANDAVQLDATVLYADLKESTLMVNNLPASIAAEIYKCYLKGCCEIIKNNEGVITSFDGDRVMAVYIGGLKNTNAVKTALNINYFVQKILNPALKKQYENLNYTVGHVFQVVGIDTGELFVARTGIRGDNDLVWVGNAANLAAKMCSIRNFMGSTFISKNVYSKMCSSVKYADDEKNIALLTRSDGHVKKIGVFSLSGMHSSVSVDVPDGLYTNLIDGRFLTVADGSFICTGEPVIFIAWCYYWFLAEI